MRVAVVVLVAACYQPTIATRVPCASNGDCPAGQVCAMNGLCELPGRDAEAIDMLPPDAIVLRGWASPRLLAELNSASSETDPTLSADGLEIVFASNRAGGVGGTDLYRASRASRNDPFGAPVLIAELSTPDHDQAAELTADGLTLYLRVAGTTSEDIASARRATRSSAFGAPMPEPALSTSEADTNPAISRDGLVFSTTHNVAGPTLDRELYLYERTSPSAAWSTPRRIDELMTPRVDSGAAFGPDGRVIVFHSDRDSPTPDLSDLFVATRPSLADPFGSVMPLAELNTPMNESDPSITADLRYIVWECNSDLCFSTR